MLVLGIDEQRIERASRATAGQIRAARRLRGRIDAGAQVTLEQLEAASAFEDEKDIEAVLAAGDGWAGKADGIRRRIEREEAKAEDYDAFGDAGVPVVKEKPEGFTYKDWANCGLAAEKLEKKEFAAGTVAVWKGSYWDLYGPQDGSDAEPEKTEEEILAEQEAAREEAALNDLYRSLIGFVASGAFAMSKDLMACVCADRGDPAALLAAMGGDSLVENDERFGAVRDEFARNLKACRPSEYEAGCWLMAAAKDMAQLNNRWGGDDAEAWLDHYDIFCSAGFEPGEEDVWLMERVQAGVSDEHARKLMLMAALGAAPHGHADSVQITDLDARMEIRDMAAELGVDADF